MNGQGATIGRTKANNKPTKEACCSLLMGRLLHRCSEMGRMQYAMGAYIVGEPAMKKVVCPANELIYQRIEGRMSEYWWATGRQQACEAGFLWASWTAILAHWAINSAK